MTVEQSVQDWEPFAWRRRCPGTEDVPHEVYRNLPYTEYRLEDSPPYRSYGNVDFEIRINVKGVATGRLVDKLPEPGSFSQALEWLKVGKRVARKGWQDKNRYVFLGSCSPNSINSEVGPGTIMSGPDCRFLAEFRSPHQIIVGWVPGQDDLLATDWVVVA